MNGYSKSFNKEFLFSIVAREINDTQCPESIVSSAIAFVSFTHFVLALDLEEVNRYYRTRGSTESVGRAQA